jgi:hypothetical protein
MRICVDMDSVLADVKSGLDDVSKDKGIDDYNYCLSFDLKMHGRPDWVSEQNLDEVFWLNLRPHRDAWYSIYHWFMCGSDITIISDRDESVREVSERWLNEWLVPYNDIMFCNQGEKHEIVSFVEDSKDCDVLFVGDNPLEVNLMNGIGLKSYCIDRDYNEGFAIDHPWWAPRIGSSVGFSELDGIVDVTKNS